MSLYTRLADILFTGDSHANFSVTALARASTFAFWSRARSAGPTHRHPPTGQAEVKCTSSGRTPGQDGR